MAATYVSHTTATVDSAATSINVTVPAGIAAGDLLIFFLSGNRNSTEFTSMTPPAGWTSAVAVVDDTASGGSLGVIYYKIATGSETSATWAWAGVGMRAVGTIMAFRGVNTATPFDDTDSTVQGSSSTTRTPLAVTTTVANDLTVCFIGDRQGGATQSFTPGSWTERVDQSMGASGARHAQFIGTLDAPTTGNYGATAVTTAATGDCATIITLALKAAVAAPASGNFWRYNGSAWVAQTAEFLTPSA